MKLLKIIMLFFFTWGLATSVNAAALCSGYRMTIGSDGMARINGEEVTSQKIKFLKAKDDWRQIKMDMAIMPARDGNMYGFQFIRRDGKAWLNVQLLQNRMSAPKIIGSFPCKIVPD